MNKSDILKAAKWRQAIKHFDPTRKISDDDFNFILEIARISPTSNGTEPWNAIVVQDKDLRQQLIKAAPGGTSQLGTASHVVILTTKRASQLKPGSDFIEHMSRDVYGHSAVKFAAWKQVYRFLIINVGSFEK